MFERTITIDSMGKTFSVTGWKVGWAIAPPPLTAALRPSISSSPSPTRRRFRRRWPTCCRSPRATATTPVCAPTTRRRRDLLTAALRAARLDPLPIDGAYFLLADLRAHGVTDDVAFCRRLVTEVGVAAIPTSVFYADPAARAAVRAVLLRQERRDAALRRRAPAAARSPAP